MVSDFTKIGLNSYESKVYSVLLEYGRLNARKISEYSGVPPTAVYPALDILLSKGLVQKFGGKVSVYESVQPSISLPALINKKKTELERLKAELVGEAESIRGKKNISPKLEVIKLSIGSEPSRAVYHNLLKSCKKSFYILGWHMYEVKDKYSFLQEFKKAIAHKIEVRMILTGMPKKNWSLVDAYIAAGIKIKYVPLDNFSILIADSKECKITLKSDSLQDKFNVQISDPSLSSALNSYFLSVWKKATDVNKLKKKN